MTDYIFPKDCCKNEENLKHIINAKFSKFSIKFIKLQYLQTFLLRWDFSTHDTHFHFFTEKSGGGSLRTSNLWSKDSLCQTNILHEGHRILRSSDEQEGPHPDKWLLFPLSFTEQYSTNVFSNSKGACSLIFSRAHLLLVLNGLPNFRLKVSISFFVALFPFFDLPYISRMASSRLFWCLRLEIETKC